MKILQFEEFGYPAKLKLGFTNYEMAVYQELADKNHTTIPQIIKRILDAKVFIEKFESFEERIADAKKSTKLREIKELMVLMQHLGI